MIARDPNTGKWRDYAKELIHGIPQHDADNWQADIASGTQHWPELTPPPGKPFVMCSREEHARLLEIEDDIAALIADYRRICSDTLPVVPLYQPLRAVFG